MAATTRVRLAYGSRGLEVDLPADRTVVVEPRFVPAVPDEPAELRRALAEPLGGARRLRDTVRPGQQVAISICDVTRPQPREPMVKAVLAELAGIVDPADVVLLVATGTHRACTPAELEAMLGRELLDACEVVNHDARDDASLVDVGTHGDGVAVLLNRRWVEADVRITTGFVEPHFFAGFSGGPKMVAPGLAGLTTILTLHDARRIGDRRATWGVCEGNPVHDDVRAIAAATGVDFAMDVVLNRDQRITGAFAGELFAMHAAARAVAREVAMRPVDRRFEVVLTSNSGYPLDQNLYQGVKGMSAAENVVTDGGLIVLAAECRDGLPDHGGYRSMLTSAPSPAALREQLAAADRTTPDQWQVQVQVRVQARARVAVHADGLTDEQIREAHLEPCHDVAAMVVEELDRAGPGAQVCVLPEGPQTIPFTTAS
jgi:lactate racemase